MSDVVWAAVVAAAGAVAAGLVTGGFAVRAAREARKLASREHQLRRALEDLLALRQLEQRYLSELAEATDEGPEAIKRRVWRVHQDDGGRRPSEAAEPARLQRALSSLDD